MRAMNPDPFWRTSIGFDRLFDLMDESLRIEPEDHYPPCNIVCTGENSFRISRAVAAFTSDQKPVILPPGRAMLSTKPAPTGLLT